MVSPLYSQNPELLIHLLQTHLPQAKVKKNVAILEVMIEGRLHPFKIVKTGLEELLLGVQPTLIETLAKNIVGGLQQLETEAKKGGVDLRKGGEPIHIEINLDENTVSINGGKAYKFKTIGEKGSKDDISKAKEHVSAEYKTAASEKTKLTNNLAALHSEKAKFEKALEHIEKVYVEAAQDRKEELYRKEKKELEEKIEELNEQLQWVQDQLDQVSLAVDKFRDELAGLKQAALLIDIFDKVQTANFQAFYGFTPPTLNRSKL